MKQVLIIHGGTSFNSYASYIENLKSQPIDYARLKLQQRWKSWIAETIPDDTEVLLPTFPNGHNAVYSEWKIYFEKLLPFLGSDVQIIGHSLGAMFLAIYLNETPLPKVIRRLILIAGGYNDDSLEELGSFVVSSAKNLPKSADEIHLFHSEDDPVVPFHELRKFQDDLPNAVSHIFTNRAHFNQPTFPELLDLLIQK